MNAGSAIIEVVTDCWNRIGVSGDRSCPELVEFMHCHNCPVFAAAARKLLDRAPPDSYLDEAQERVAAVAGAEAADSHSALVFRVGEEWLALPVHTLVEVHALRPVHRIPHRGGLLAGLVNIRGELQLCVRFDQLLGISPSGPASGTASHPPAESSPADRATARLLVVELDSDRWVFPVDEVDQVCRFATTLLAAVPATIARYNGRLSRGVFDWKGRMVGYLDDSRMLQTLRARLKP
jgi:chemotaxis-related protein WspD